MCDNANDMDSVDSRQQPPHSLSPHAAACLAHLQGLQLAIALPLCSKIPAANASLPTFRAGKYESHQGNEVRDSQGE
jgi:hypothetical protein